MTPRLAVCITYYNEGRLLVECLQSLYAGTRLPDEVLVYDDASYDPAEQYLKDFPQVRLIRGAVNRGPGYARDRLITASTCDYIHLHDSDDTFMPTWSEALFKVMDAAHPNIIITDADRISELTDYDPYKFQLSKLQPTDGIPLYKAMLQQPIVPALITFKRQIALDVGGHRWREVINMGEDYEFFTRLALYTNNFISIDQKLIRKIERRLSYSQSHNSEAFDKLYAESHLKLSLLQMPMLPVEERKRAAAGLLALLTNPVFVNPILVEKASRLLFLWARQQKLTHLSPRLLVVRFLGVQNAVRLANVYQKLLPIKLRRMLTKS